MNRQNASALVVIVLWSIGCARGPGLPYAAPGDVGMDAGRTAAIRTSIERFVDDGTASGIVTLVAKDGRIVSLESVGRADIETNQPMTDDTIFRIASMTKPITATALMTLVDEGRIALDDPVSRYIPAFADARTVRGPIERPVTLRDCLMHTAGLGGSQIFTGTLEQNVNELATRPLMSQPGTRWAYSPGLNVIGRVIEIVCGQSYGDFLHERIFEPLGMVDTTFDPTDAQWPRVATVYKPGAQAGTLAPVTEGWSRGLGRTLGPQPSGGLFSTAQDLAAFYQMVLNGGRLNGQRIVSERSARLMTTMQTGDLRVGFTPGNAWGLGWCIIVNPTDVTGMLSAGTYGHGGAFGTQGWVDPHRRMIFILLIQREGLPNADGSELRKAFQSAAVSALR